MQDICCGGMFLEFCTNVATGTFSQRYCLPYDKVPTVTVLLRCSDWLVACMQFLSVALFIICQVNVCL